MTWTSLDSLPASWDAHAGGGVQMSRMFWYLERHEKGAANASWDEEFAAFDQVLEIATVALSAGRSDIMRFIAPDGAPRAQIEQLLALGVVDGSPI